VLPLLPRVCHVSEAHLRDGHLRDVDERLQVAAPAAAAAAMLSPSSISSSAVARTDAFDRAPIATPGGLLSACS
jgi:hypothetical protein